jgi:hypothetical protein
LKGDHLRIISAKFGWDWLRSFIEDFFLISSPLFLICFIDQNRQKFKVRKKSQFKKIFSETTEPISTKLCWNDP